MNEHGNDERAVRREVGRRLLSLRQALSRALTRYDATKMDDSDDRVARACDACEEALREVRALASSLDAMRASLANEGAPQSARRERTSAERLSLAS